LRKKKEDNLQKSDKKIDNKIILPKSILTVSNHSDSAKSDRKNSPSPVREKDWKNSPSPVREKDRKNSPSPVREKDRTSRSQKYIKKKEKEKKHVESARPRGLSESMKVKVDSLRERKRTSSVSQMIPPGKPKKKTLI